MQHMKTLKNKKAKDMVKERNTKAHNKSKELYKYPKKEKIYYRLLPRLICNQDNIPSRFGFICHEK